MKNVAATRGHSVNFADFFGEAIAREGNWAGRDKVLNFLSRPPSDDPRSLQPVTWSEFAKCRIRLFCFDARRICKESEIFWGRAGARLPEFLAIDAGERESWRKISQTKKGGGEAPSSSCRDYCGVVPSAMRLAWRRSRCSWAQAFCCSGVITAQTCLRVSILICFSFCWRWSSVSAVSFFTALS